jgi:O-antigen/teichoic acid export membrane protein
MKAFVTRLRADPRYSKIFEWGVLVSITGSAQLFVQGLGVLSGFLIIHMLSTHEYALYTLAYTMLGTLVALADGGITSGVLAHGAKSWQDKQRMGEVVATGLYLRRKFSMISLAVSMPVLLVLLIRHGAAWQFAVLIVLALLPAFLAGLTEDIFEIPVRLHQDIKALQKNAIAVNVARFVLLLSTVVILPFAAVAILANGLPRIWANYRLRKIAVKFTDFSMPVDKEIQKGILTMVKRTLPGAIYYCISSQLSIWLISIYGNTEAIAQIGALGRLAAILTVIGGIFSTLIVPRFARLPERSDVLLLRFFQTIGILLVISAFSCGLAYFFPKQVLYLLGKNYSGLDAELLLSVLGACVSMMVGIVYALSLSRTWVVPVTFNVVSCIAVQALLVFLLDFSTARGVLVYGLLNSIWVFTVFSGYLVYRIVLLRKVEAKAP